MHGLAETPNTTRANCSSIVAGFSRSTLSNQRNSNTSLPCSAMEAIRKAFSISAVRGFGCDRNLSKMSSIFWLNLGPGYRQSLSDGPVSGK